MNLSSRPRVDIRGVGFDNVTLDEAALAIVSHAEADEGKLLTVFTPNSEIVQLSVEDGTGNLRRIINSAGLVIPDSTGIIKAAKIFGTPLSEKIAGVELGDVVLALSAKRGIPVYFLGGKPGVAETAKEKTEAKYPGLFVVGCGDGFFEKHWAASDEVIEKIASAHPAILYVCLGAPAQEVWIYENSEKLSRAGVRAALALGGSLDIYAGLTARAPKLFISLGLEWLYRLLREPSRLGRMTALPRFYFGCRAEARAKKRAEKK